MTSKYEKLVLEDLPKSAVVNSKAHAKNPEVEELINEVLTEHLTKIVDTNEEFDSESANKIDKSVDELTESYDINSANSDVNNNSEVDLEFVKKESYQNGFTDAQTKYESMLLENNSAVSLSEKINEKLSLVSPSKDIDSQIAKVSAEAISGIAKKLHLILPSNFEEIITKGLIDKLKSFYKDGNIVLTIHPDRYEYCREILQLDSIPSKFKDNFQIVKDEKLGNDDCILDWEETRLEYNQEQLAAEIDKIIEQLKSAT
jgi:flagellar biosynthesis/type III secretory pathway protein FliH